MRADAQDPGRGAATADEEAAADEPCSGDDGEDATALCATTCAALRKVTRAGALLPSRTAKEQLGRFIRGPVAACCATNAAAGSA